MSLDNNVYYYPEKLGLKILGGVLDDDDKYHAFHFLVVWRHTESGRLFWAEDSSCSCPAPFEDYDFNGPSDTNLYPLVSETLRAFEMTVRNFPAPDAERAALLRKVREALQP